MTATLTQTGSTICGGAANCTLTLAGSPCFASTTLILGTASTSAFNFEAIFRPLLMRDEEAPRINYTGELIANGRTASGQFTVQNGRDAVLPSPCAGDSGTWTAQRQ